jgi:folylpolyglutamate synthase/dihydropteroate synthase
MPASYRDWTAAHVGPADVHADFAGALACAGQAAGTAGLVCVAGSLYLVGEARQLLSG